MMRPELPPHAALMSDQYWQGVVGDYPGSIYADPQPHLKFTRQQAGPVAARILERFTDLGERPTRVPVPDDELLPVELAARGMMRLDVDRRHATPDNRSRHFYAPGIVSPAAFDARIAQMSEERLYAGPRAQVNGVLPDGRHATLEREVWYGIAWGARGLLAAMRGEDIKNYANILDWSRNVRLFSDGLVVGARYNIPQLAESVREHSELTVVAATLLLRRQVRDATQARIIKRR